MNTQSLSRQRYLIAYDIACPRRLGRVHRFLVKMAIPVQYSVFLAWLGPQGRRDLIAYLTTLIHPQQDDVRIYPLPANLTITTLGIQHFPSDDLYWIGDPPAQITKKEGEIMPVPPPSRRHAGASSTKPLTTHKNFGG